MPDLLKILTHLRLIVTTIEDGEHAIVDLVHKDKTAAAADGLKALNDLGQLFIQGLIVIPGVDAAEIISIINGLLPAGATQLSMPAKKA